MTIFKSKTLQFALLIAVLSVLQGFVFLVPVTPTQQMFIGILLAIIVTILRFVTTQPLSEK